MTAMRLSMMRRILASTALFLCISVLGPVLRLTTWPQSAFESRFSGRTVGFVNDLMILLWPPVLIGDGEGGAKTLQALAGINLLFFVVLGAIVGGIGTTRGRLLTVYLVLCALIAWLELWGAGFSRAYLNPGALLVALILYAIPFAIIIRRLGHINEEI